MLFRSFYVLFNAPFIVNTQNGVVFYVSILIAIIVSIVYVFLISSISETSEETPRMYSLAVGIPMFVAMLYFLNMIPGVPLSLTEGGIYHNVQRLDTGEYLVEEEENKKFFAGLRTKVHTISPTQNDVFFLSAIRAPQKMTAPITHVWEYYDDVKGAWVTSTTIPFTLSGGREDGYRAYSHKENIFEGLWRVTVKVDEKRIVGRVKFYIKKGEPKHIVEKTI